MPKCSSSRLPHSLVRVKQARNVVCDARWGRLRERAGAMSGLAGAHTAAYGTLANRAQFRRRVRMVIAAASGQAVSRHCSQPLHLLPRRSTGTMHASHCQWEACIPAISAVLSSRGLPCGCQTKECVRQVACSQLLYLSKPLGHVCALHVSSSTAVYMRICSA